MNGTRPVLLACAFIGKYPRRCRLWQKGHRVVVTRLGVLDFVGLFRQRGGKEDRANSPAVSGALDRPPLR